MARTVAGRANLSLDLTLAKAKTPAELAARELVRLLWKYKLAMEEHVNSWKRGMEDVDAENRK